VLDNVLQAFKKKKETGLFRVPGALDAGARVLAIAPDDLTDLLFHVPLLTGLRRQHPGASIDFLLPEPFAPLVVPSGLARQVLVYTEKQLKGWRPAVAALHRQLAKGEYTVSIVLSVEPRPDLEALGLASGAALRVGPSHSGGYPAVNLEVRAPAEGQGYRGQLPQRLAPFLGLDATDLQTAWPLPPDRLRQTAQLVHFNKPNPDELLVGVDPGLGKAGQGFALDNLLFLVRQITSQVNCRVLPLSGPDGQDRVAKMEPRIPGMPQGLKRDTLLETILLLCQCDLFVAGNTDLLHFAVAQGVPTIGLFSAQDGTEWRPGPREHARILDVAKGEKVDIATLMETVEAVTGGRGAVVRKVRSEAAPGAAESPDPGAGKDPGSPPQP